MHPLFVPCSRSRPNLALYTASTNLRFAFAYPHPYSPLSFSHNINGSHYFGISRELLTMVAPMSV
ncbi:hypothetical protein V8C34DRAFT_285289 [Trichoderma compactum]